MGIIDEKGRLFGKINLIDFLVIVSMFCLLPMFYFGYKILNRPVVVVQKEEAVFTTVVVHAEFKNLSPEVASLISIGDKEVEEMSYSVGEILDVGKIESNFVKVNLGKGNTIIKEEAHKRQVLVKMSLTGRLRGEDIFFKGNEVKIGSTINFKTDEYEIQGKIIPKTRRAIIRSFISGLNPINLEVLFKNMSPEVARLVSAGDFEVNEDGDTIAKVLSVGKLEPYSYKVDLGGGNFLTRTDSQKRQVLAKIEILGRIEGEAFYFRGKRIALDSEIEFHTNKYRIKGTVEREPASVKKVDKEWAVLKVKFTNLIPELVDFIKVGDTEEYISGELVAEVRSILSNEPAKVIVGTMIREDGKLEIGRHPLNKDVVLSIKALCTKAQEGLFFKESRIKIGNHLSLQTDKYDISGIIIGIE